MPSISLLAEWQGASHCPPCLTSTSWCSPWPASWCPCSTTWAPPPPAPTPPLYPDWLSSSCPGWNMSSSGGEPDFSVLQHFGMHIEGTPLCNIFKGILHKKNKCISSRKAQNFIIKTTSTIFFKIFFYSYTRISAKI